MITFTTQTLSEVIAVFKIRYGYSYKVIADTLQIKDFSRKLRDNDWNPLEKRSVEEYIQSVIDGKPIEIKKREPALKVEVKTKHYTL